MYPLFDIHRNMLSLEKVENFIFLTVSISAPYFTKHPEFRTPVKIITDNTFLFACNFASHFNISESDVYWLKNGYEKVQIGLSGRNPIVAMGGSVLRTLDIAFEVPTYFDQGSYQCVVYNRYTKREVKSRKLHLQYEGE